MMRMESRKSGKRVRQGNEEDDRRGLVSLKKVNGCRGQKRMME
jgi:hypothetical protein